MKLVTYMNPDDWASGPRVGAVLDDEMVVDLRAAVALHGGQAALPSTLLEFIEGGDRLLDIARAALERVAQGDGRERDGVCVGLASVTLLPPLPRPRSIRQFSLIEQHMLNAIETMRKRESFGGERPALTGIPPAWYQIPAYFKSSVEEVYGPGDTIPWPQYTSMLDFEFELAAVVGRRGRAISAADAESHIVGYTIFNDWSARDVQQLEMSVNLGPGICKDFASSMGPYLVTRDEFDISSTLATVCVDGEIWARTAVSMRLDFPDLLVAISGEQTLMPGDVLTSGTVAGGCGIEHDRWIAPGSEVALGATGLGVLTNTVGLRGGGAPLPPSQRLPEPAMTEYAPTIGY
jgi:2-keto-4-pentenoate hydratase/2-oxohepta-3-ene-1,7-dioic acid hydratase in catechol pathway